MFDRVGLVLLEVEPGIDPNIVKPGWTPLLILIVLGVALAILYRSMRRQVRRINLPDSTPPAQAPTAQAPAEQTAPEHPAPEQTAPEHLPAEGTVDPQPGSSPAASATDPTR